MNIDTYIRLSRTLQKNRPREAAPYVEIYASLLRLFGHRFDFTVPPPQHTFPDLIVVYSLQRSHELVIIDDDFYLLYDQYLGQTFNMLNRILLNSDDPHDGMMYGFKLLAEHYATMGEATLTSVCAGSYAKMQLECNSYRREANLARRNAITTLQETFMMAHELAHVVLRSPSKYFDVDDINALGDGYSAFTEHIAKCVGVPAFDCVDHKTSDSIWMLEEFPNISEVILECRCDALAALLTIAVRRHFGDRDFSDSLLAIVLALRHLRVLGAVRHVADGQDDFDEIMWEYVYRSSAIRRTLNAMACVLPSEDYVHEVVESSDRYEHLIDDPILLLIRDRFAESNVIREFKGMGGELPRQRWLKLLSDLTGVPSEWMG